VVSFILDLIANLVGGLVDALPSWDAPSVDAVGSLGSFLRQIDYFVPIAGPMAFTVGMLAALPYFLALRFGLMVWGLVRGGGPS
jgi:hypothetical protein